LLVGRTVDVHGIVDWNEFPTIPGWRYERLPAIDPHSASADETFLWNDGRGLSVFRIGRPEANRVRLTFRQLDMAFDVDRIRRTVSNCSGHTLSPANVRHFIADQVVPRVLESEGNLVLHAASVRVDDGAILIIGESGRGKSTLSASFERAGFGLMGDDAVVVSALEDGPCAVAVYPSLRLRPDTLAALMPADTASTPVADYTSKRRLALPDAEPPAPLAIRAAFVLAQPGDDPAIRVGRLSVAQACMTFVEHSFALNPVDPQRARARLLGASALARQVPAFGLDYPRAYDRLPEVRQAILETLAQLVN
jgi:hypothetical protein